MKRLLQTIETHHLLRIALVMIISVSVAGYFFQPALQHPSGVLYATGGDGIKNYYTPIWYITHDSGTVFSGMNYPYTDNFVYSDCQPLISYSLKCLNGKLHLTPPRILAVINLLPIFCLIFSCLLIYYILRRARLPYWYALFFGVIINFHAPQVARLLGAHYGLSYTCFVPLVWICIDAMLNKKWAGMWAILTSAILLAFSFLHPYYLPIGFFMIGGYGFVHFVQQRNQFKCNWTRYASLAIGALLPVLFLKLWMLHYDHLIFDRVRIPYGLEVYHSSFYSLFFPESMPHPTGAYYNFEGIAYIGWFGLIALIITGVKFGSYLLRRKFNRVITPVAPNILQTSPWLSLLFFFLANASILLLLSNSLPSAFEGLKQFRSVGRFAWVFYYLFACWSVWLLYLIIRKLQMKGIHKLARTVLFIFCSLSAYETYFCLSPIRTALAISWKENSAHNFLAKENNYAEWITSSGHKVKEFQAILPIPFFNMGSEKVGEIYSPSTVYEAFKASLSTGLPITTAYTTRASVGQTNSIVQILANPLIPKSVFNYYPHAYPDKSKPLLIVYNKKKLAADDTRMLSYAHHFFSNEYVELYSLDLQEVDSICNKALVQAKEKVESGKVLSPLIFEAFNARGDNRKDYYFSENDATVKEWKLPSNLQEDSLVVSCWVGIQLKYAGMPQLTYTWGGKALHVNPANYHDINDDWVIVQDTIVAKGGDVIKLSVVGKQNVLDNFQVRYKHQHTWVKNENDSTGFYDGYVIPPIIYYER